MANKKGSSFNLMDICAFIAVCLGGITLFIATLLGNILNLEWGFISYLRTIADIIGWVVLCLLSFNFIKSKKSLWMWIIWVIAVVMIVVGIILPIF